MQYRLSDFIKTFQASLEDLEPYDSIILDINLMEEIESLKHFRQQLLLKGQKMGCDFVVMHSSDPKYCDTLVLKEKNRWATTPLKVQEAVFLLADHPLPALDDLLDALNITRDKE